MQNEGTQKQKATYSMIPISVTAWERKCMLAVNWLVVPGTGRRVGLITVGPEGIFGATRLFYILVIV